VSEPSGRDRDPAGRARNARPRDALGRPLPRSAAQDVPRIPDDLVISPAEAAALGGRLLAEGQPFHAHEVFEAAWKSLPGPDRELWRGLAQVAVGLTHARRGNARGATALLRRGAGHVAEFAGPGLPSTVVPNPGLPDPGLPDPGAEVDAGFVAGQAADLALRIERDGLAGVPEADLRLRLRP
jgi:hypothetical protein